MKLLDPKIAFAGLAAGVLLTADVGLLAQNQMPEDEEAREQTIIVTATRLRQSGSQDIKQFRSLSLDGEFLPRPESLTIEGLLGEYDLALPSKSECDQLFCIAGYAAEANLPTRPQDEYFVGLGFESNADADALQKEPLSLIAVIDRSGSMSGEKIARAKEGLLQAISMMRDGDRLGIVEFGTETNLLLPVTDIGGNRELIAETISAIEAEGSTFMEAGLRLGFETAFEELEQSGRKTRMMLLTDEKPNVGNTDPEGFMGQAVSGSRRGVGMTTIGVGRDFDNALAMQLSSVRGGNLFYLATDADAPALFQREFFNMVTEVAHDVTITMTPSAGYKLNAVYGVPNEVLTQTPAGAITVTIGSAFLSSNGGGIFTSLETTEVASAPPNEQPLMSVAVSYTDARSGAAGTNSDTVMLPGGEVPQNLKLAQALVDEYLSLSGALELYHAKGDAPGAYRMISGLSERLGGAEFAGIGKEREMVAGLLGRAGALAGQGDVPAEMRHLGVIGRWEVTRQRGLNDVLRGDTVELTGDGELITERKSGPEAGREVYQTFQINEDQMHINYTDLVFYYRLKGEKLQLRGKNGKTKLFLKRIGS
ncbi:vWA domain-containing protein [Pontixanthobacter luteolus]|uniref:vWA domain-containing protein n=1 Tax=Pontixanthobacter luteolus TaxID=295089 RepID=UPI002302C053|nr:VWA domain-containing protein [Pontixanthobacter luteolus]